MSHRHYSALSNKNKPKKEMRGTTGITSITTLSNRLEESRESIVGTLMSCAMLSSPLRGKQTINIFEV